MMITANRRIILVSLILLAVEKCLSQVVCSSKACDEESKRIRSKLDSSVDACDDFYKFSCGNFKPEIPNDKIKIDSFETIQDSLRERLYQVMGAEIDEDEIIPFRNVKTFYQNCIDKETIERVGLHHMKEYLSDLGGWPVIETNWNESLWSWQQMIKDFEMTGVTSNYLFELSIANNPKNSSTRIIWIDQPSFGLSREYLIEGLDDKLVQAYKSYQIDMAVIYGANRTEAEREMAEALELEMQIANISLAQEDRRNSTKLFNPITVKSLQMKFPSLNWIEYFNSFLSPATQLNENEVVVMSNENLFLKLYDILQSTPKRTIANYLMWRVSLSSASFLNEIVRNRSLEYSKVINGKKEDEDRWKECVAQTSNYLPNSVGALYVRKFFNEESKEIAMEMEKDIKKEFEETLKEVSWMDEKTRQAALKKAKEMQNHIGYPNELMDDQKLINLHKDLVIPRHEYLRSVWSLNHFRLRDDVLKFREIINKTDWETHSDVAIVNAYYRWLENSILIPAGIMQGQFFSADRPRYINYASIGYVIGHEITHGFDDQGSQYDADGNLEDWWQEGTKKAYLDKARCIIEQYGNFTEPSTNLKLNGINTQGENIADNGGILIAYRAYQKWVKANGKENSLPDLDFTPNQMFWISVGQAWCSTLRIEEMKKRITTDAHSIAQFRVIGPLRNIEEFSVDFNCPEGSLMNPANKCKVW